MKSRTLITGLLAILACAPVACGGSEGIPPDGAHPETVGHAESSLTQPLTFTIGVGQLGAQNGYPTSIDTTQVMALNSTSGGWLCPLQNFVGTSATGTSAAYQQQNANGTVHFGSAAQAGDSWIASWRCEPVSNFGWIHPQHTDFWNLGPSNSSEVYWTLPYLQGTPGTGPGESINALSWIVGIGGMFPNANHEVDITNTIAVGVGGGKTQAFATSIVQTIENNTIAWQQIFLSQNAEPCISNCTTTSDAQGFGPRVGHHYFAGVGANSNRSTNPPQFIAVIPDNSTDDLCGWHQMVGPFNDDADGLSVNMGGAQPFVVASDSSGVIDCMSHN